MLELKNITKQYYVGDQTVDALKGISVNFRKSEFVAILGPSGCGKTTMLNIIGGLDRYTTGDLLIGGISTKQYRDADWDTYRNHSIGFVFQSYNLIPHQTVLENVELALTLSGVSKKERRERAARMLERVGLGDKLKNRPNQLSGGQCQRVSIARALINDPEIILADEPTGALDSATSVQIMELLREIAKDKLVIMVTHNPDLAEQYATRIVRFKDGLLIDDSNPYDGAAEREEEAERVRLFNEAQKGSKKKKKQSIDGKKRASMSFWTALSLSFKNLLTKKARTMLVSMAGSIGIIGIALILSISSGVQLYINQVQEDTLSSYPITVEEETMDMTSVVSNLMGVAQGEITHDKDQIYANNVMIEMFQAVMADVYSNNLKDFKTYLDDENSDIARYISSVKYGYDITMRIYTSDTSGGVTQVNPGSVLNGIVGSLSAAYGAFTVNAWSEMLDNDELVHSQYELLAGHWPDRNSPDYYRQIVLFADKNNEISDYILYSLGLADAKELNEMMNAILNGQEYEQPQHVYTYDELLNTTYKMVLAPDLYRKSDGVWQNMSDNANYMKNVVQNATELQIVGIVRPSESATAASVTGTIGYTSALTRYYLESVSRSQIVQEQLADPTRDVFTGKRFVNSGEKPTMDEVRAYVATLPAEEQQQFNDVLCKILTEEEIIEMFTPALMENSNTYEKNLAKLDYADPAKPSRISIYAKDFQSKDGIVACIERYNERQIQDGKKENVITYTDYVGLMMSSISTIIDIISYVLIAFVGVSLVVSSIMIGIITYISVLERIKEIGILRSVGASKQDISNVFNAEAIIIGFAAGVFGILVTLLLDIPINLIIYSLSGIATIARLPVAGAFILIGISVLLTFIAGLIPSRIAAKKDPVEALRTE